VVGGGDTNTAAAQKSVIAGGSGNNIKLFDSLPFEANQYCVISGGQSNNRGDDWEYRTTGSVITGGKKNSFNAPITAGNPTDHMTISGGRNNIVRGRQSVVTGGKDIDSYGLQSVVLGGQNNQALGNYSAVPGGFKNMAGGKASIAMGMKAKVEHDHSMVINLQGNAQPVVSTAPGQFLVQAKEYKFQVTNDPGPNDENVLFLDAKNIQRLQDAIDSLPTRRRELSPEMTDKRVLRREAKERRQRKLQLAREKYGLSWEKKRGRRKQRNNQIHEVVVYVKEKKNTVQKRIIYNGNVTKFQDALMSIVKSKHW